MAKHRVIRHYLNAQKQTIDRFSLARAKGHIQQIIEREFFTTKKIRRRRRLKSLLQSETVPTKEGKSTPVVSSPNLSPENDKDDLPEMAGWSSDYGLPITGDDRP